MIKALKKHALLIIALLLSAAMFLHFGRIKGGLFIDEIYTLGLSNSYYAPFISDAAGGEFKDVLLTRELMLEYLSVGEGDAFAFGSVYYNQVRDVHPPLYYWLVNIAYSLVPGSVSKWVGLGLNFPIYMLGLVIMYALGNRLFGDRRISALCTMMYGMSAIGLSSAIMIRMYVLLGTLTICLAYFALLYLQERRARHCLAIGLTITAGLMTQYYFVFYAFFLCAAVIIFLLAKREYRAMFGFSVCALGGVGLFVCAFPACLDHLFSGNLVSGQNAVQNLSKVSQYAKRLGEYMGSLMELCFAGFILCIIALVIHILTRFVKGPPDEKERTFGAMLLIPAVLALIICTLVSPIVALRYVYNIAPILYLIPGLLLSASIRRIGKAPYVKWAVPALLILGIAGSVLSATERCIPEYINPEHLDRTMAIEAHSAHPCIYITDKHFEPVTLDMLQLMLFEDVFVSNDCSSEKMMEYISGHKANEALVVYIDVDEVWSSGYNAEEIISQLEYATDYGMDYLICSSGGTSEAYLFTAN